MGGAVFAVTGRPFQSALVDEVLDEPSRVVISPFLNVDQRLESQTDVSLFTVTANEPSYWRLATLDIYEDDIWRSTGDFLAVPDADLSNQTDQTIRQVFGINGLSSIWLPVAPEPVVVAADGATEIEANSAAGTYVVSADRDNSDGVQYSAHSEPVVASVDSLRAVPPTDPIEITGQYLALDEVNRAIAADLTAELTTDQPTRYDQVRAIQDHFRGFDYEVGAGADANALERTLTERSGAATDLASAFAVMARTVDIPSRVAVGFTWGSPGETVDDLTTYEVFGRHAHVWPEIYFEGIGWVPFEPTPGRGIPGASNYTGVNAEQSE